MLILIAFVIEISGFLSACYQILSNDSNKKHTAIAFVIEISGLLSTGYQILSNDTNKKHTAIAFIEISGFLSTGYQILSNDSNIYSRISAVHKQAKTAESILVSTIRFPVNKQLVIVIVKALRSNLSVVWEDSVQIEHAQFSIVSLVSAPPRAPPESASTGQTDRRKLEQIEILSAIHSSAKRLSTSYVKNSVLPP